MKYGREAATASVLTNGKVLVTGGQGNSDPLNRAELYDPSTHTWSTTGNWNNPRYFHTASLLTNGKVLVAGGLLTGGVWDGVTLDSTELYDPAAGNWTTADNLNDPRSCHTSCILTNGKVLVTGGHIELYVYLTSAELY